MSHRRVFLLLSSLAIVSFNSGEVEEQELYDLASNPDELTNLAFNRDFADKLSELRAAIIADDAGMADSLPAVKMAF